MVGSHLLWCHLLGRLLLWCLHLWSSVDERSVADGELVIILESEFFVEGHPVELGWIDCAEVYDDNLNGG